MNDIEGLIIDPEFESLIPPLDQDEHDRLEKSILEEKALIDPIIVWKGEGIIVDGHHRYKIIKDHPEAEIHFEIYEKEFPDRYAAQAWMCKNHLGKRNLTPEKKKYLVGKEYEAAKLSERFYGNQYTLGDESGLDQNDHHQTHGTRSLIAKKNKTSEGYVQRADKFAQGVDLAEETVPGIKEEIFSRKIKPTDKDMTDLLSAEDPEERQKIVEGLYDKKKPLRSGQVTSSQKSGLDQIDPDGSNIPITHVTLKDAKKVLDAMEHPSGTVSADDVIYELNDALRSMMFRWRSCIERNPEIVKESSYKYRRDELIDTGLEFLKDFREQY